MRYRQKNRQISYGEAIGILLIENYVPFIPGDVANASSYPFPVRFASLPGFTPARLFAHDTSFVDEAIAAGRTLVDAGVRAVTGDCGFLALYQTQIAAELGIPVFLSSLLQLDFMDRIISPGKRIGIITANKASMDHSILSAVSSVSDSRLVIAGLEDKRHFVSAVFDEDGVLDSEIVEKEVLQAVSELEERTGSTPLGAILLECSLLPPYAAAVQEATGLPVFDYNTMIGYVYSTVVRNRFSGIM